MTCKFQTFVIDGGVTKVPCENEADTTITVEVIDEDKTYDICSDHKNQIENPVSGETVVFPEQE